MAAKGATDGHQAGDRRVAGQGEDDRRLSRPGLRRRGLDRPHPRAAAQRRRRPGASTRASRGPGSASTSTTTSRPLYVVSADRKQQVSKLKALVKDADELYLATDEDREGEAIAWHLVETLNPKVPVRRMVFHEITPSAIAAAVANPREIDDHLVDAQRDPADPRPALRLRGQPGAVEEGAAGAVRRPGAVGRHPHGRRARARADGVPHARPTGTSSARSPRRSPSRTTPTTFTATLVSVDDTRLATGRDFDPATGRAPSNVLHLDEAGARGLAARLDGRDVQPSRASRRSRTAAARTRRS